MQSGLGVRASRRASAWSTTSSGTGSTIVRGGWGIFYDRPQGNIVFDMANNAPTLLQPTLQYGLLQNLAVVDRRPVPDARDVSRRRTTSTRRYVQQWNIGIQQKLPMNMVFDIAYVGSKSENLLEQDQINAVPLGARSLAANQDPTKPATGNNAAAGRPAAALPGLRRHPHVGLRWLLQLPRDEHGRHEAATTRATCSRCSTSGARPSAPPTATGAPGCRTPPTRRTTGSTTRTSDYDRPHNFVINAIYQVPKLVENKAAGILINDWQLSGVYRWNSRPAVHRRRRRSRASTSRAAPTSARASWSPATRAAARAATRTSSSTPPASRRRASAARVTSRRASSCTCRPINNVDMSHLEELPALQADEVRDPRRRVQRAEPHAVHHVNTTANFAGLAAARSPTCPTTRPGSWSTRPGSDRSAAWRRRARSR